MGDKPAIGLLQWRCRRGTKELDKILNGFLEEDYAQATRSVQSAFVRLLECQDPDIYAWLLGAKQPDSAEIGLIVKILRRKF